MSVFDRRLRLRTGAVAAMVCLMAVAGATRPTRATATAPDLWLKGAIVTMDADRSVIPVGNLLVRDGRIAAIWAGRGVPKEVDTRGAVVIDPGPGTFIYPGLINLHDHPYYAALPTWVPPSSHVQADRGRVTGQEPYDQRYDWNIVSVTSPPEYRRLVDTASRVLTDPAALNLSLEVVKLAEARGILAGQTSSQGAPAATGYDTLLSRNVDNLNFGRDRIESRVASIGTLSGGALAGLQQRLATGATEAWLVHAAEGVRDGDRHPGDTFSSRAEFARLQQLGLLTDATVIVHGTALEADDFGAMRAAPPARADGVGDGLGAKLVWSPLSNLLLYGRTTQVLAAADAGVLVSLGTDWMPSGSPTLLQELKVADAVLRHPSAPAGIPSGALAANGPALDQWLVEMVTINPARTLRWDAEVGSLEPGKVADIVMVRDPLRGPGQGTPMSRAYRALIDATERDVQLVLVDGVAQAGTVDAMAVLKPGDFEIVTSQSGCVVAAIDVTQSGVPRGSQRLPQVMTPIRLGLQALGGDAPTAGGGTSPITNTYSYLKARFLGTAGLTHAQFFQLVVAPFAGLVGGRINLEAVTASPVLPEDDRWRHAVLDADLSSVVWPYGQYLANHHQMAGGVNLLAGVAGAEQRDCR